MVAPETLAPTGGFAAALLLEFLCGQRRAAPSRVRISPAGLYNARQQQRRRLLRASSAGFLIYFSIFLLFKFFCRQAENFF